MPRTTDFYYRRAFEEELSSKGSRQYSGAHVPNIIDMCFRLLVIPARWASDQRPSHPSGTRYKGLCFVRTSYRDLEPCHGEPTSGQQGLLGTIRAT